jgi:Dodecin
MAVASVTKITAASSEGFDAAVREGLARANRTLRGITGPSRNRAQGKRGERKNRGVQGNDGGDLHPRKLKASPARPALLARVLFSRVVGQITAAVGIRTEGSGDVGRRTLRARSRLKRRQWLTGARAAKQKQNSPRARSKGR